MEVRLWHEFVRYVGLDCGDQAATVRRLSLFEGWPVVGLPLPGAMSQALSKAGYRSSSIWTSFACAPALSSSAVQLRVEPRPG